MGTKAMFDIKEMLCSDLDQYARKGSLTKNDLDTVHMITDTIKNLDKITMIEEEGYSYGEGNWNANGSYSNGMPMSDGRYSGRRMSYGDNGNTNSGRRYMRNNYSNDSADMEYADRMRREMPYN